MIIPYYAIIVDDQQYYTASDSEMNAMEVHSSSNNGK